jgi:hypothetical protein
VSYRKGFLRQKRSAPQRFAENYVDAAVLRNLPKQDGNDPRVRSALIAVSC